MKTIPTFLSVIMATVASQAAGLINIQNNSATLISVNGTPMPTNQQFIFAVFLGPSSTVATTNQFASFTDPVFQLAGGYTTNTPLAAGRVTTRVGLDVGSISGYAAGDTVDFVVRGWSSNMGYTWAEALASWNNGSPFAIGSSTVGNDLILGGGAIPFMNIFGSGQNQVGGFHLIPEPSSMALAGLGVTSLLLFRRHIQPCSGIGLR